jgi:hypothetical protein
MTLAHANRTGSMSSKSAVANYLRAADERTMTKSKAVETIKDLRREYPHAPNGI